MRSERSSYSGDTCTHHLLDNYHFIHILLSARVTSKALDDQKRELQTERPFSCLHNEDVPFLFRITQKRRHFLAALDDTIPVAVTFPQRQPCLDCCEPETCGLESVAELVPAYASILVLVSSFQEILELISPHDHRHKIHVVKLRDWS